MSNNQSDMIDRSYQRNVAIQMIEAKIAKHKKILHTDPLVANDDALSLSCKAVIQELEDIKVKLELSAKVYKSQLNFFKESDFIC